MNILLPMHHFTDNPTSGIEAGLWNFTKHLAEMGNKVFVVTISVDLVDETKVSLKQKNIFLYQIYNYKTHGMGYAESFMTFIFSVFLRIFHKFDWIFVIDEAKTPFSRFKLGAKLASRVLAPETKAAKEIFNTGEWIYDRKRKDEAEGWNKRKMPFLYRLNRFIAIRIWYKLFPVHKRGQNSDILFCEGKEALKYFREKERNNPVYLPLGVESYRFDTFNDDLINTHGKFVYLFMGRILRMKGVYFLIKAFKSLVSRYPNMELWIIGSSFGEYTRDLENEMRGFEDKIKVLGKKGRSDIIRYIKSANVMVDPMIWANFSSVALEALYCERPLIAPFFGNSKDFIIDGETGFLVDSRNIDKLAERMEYYYNNYDEAQRMAKNGGEFVKKYLTWDKVAKIADDNFRFFNDDKKIKDLNKKYENFDY
jgi:glycosyltransferase involved in cell wall biosynthesis